MRNPGETATWEAVFAEIALWSRKPRLFLRDDDAAKDTPALRYLIELSARFDAPLLLASLGGIAEDSLGEAVADAPHVTGAVHGNAHVNHAPTGEKPCELGSHRPLEAVLDELRRSRARLAELFGDRLSVLCVPPWNRIAREVEAHVGEAGFAGVSAHGWLKGEEAAPRANAHLDIIHWSAGGSGRNIGWIAGELASNLRQARQRGGRAVGILTHHLAHDEIAWDSLGALFRALENEVEWIAADTVLLDPPEPVQA